MACTEIVEGKRRHLSVSMCAWSPPSRRKGVRARKAAHEAYFCQIAFVGILRSISTPKKCFKAKRTLHEAFFFHGASDSQGCFSVQKNGPSTRLKKEKRTLHEAEEGETDPSRGSRRGNGRFTTVERTLKRSVKKRRKPKAEREHVDWCRFDAECIAVMFASQKITRLS